MCIVMPSLFVNCPAVICLPNMLVICSDRDTTSELWTLVQFPHIVYTTCCNHLLLAVFPAVFHTIRLTLYFCKTGEIHNLSVSCWAKFWFVSVQIPRWCKLPSARGSQHQQPSDRSSSPTGLITLGRFLKGKLLLSTS